MSLMIVDKGRFNQTTRASNSLNQLRPYNVVLRISLCPRGRMVKATTSQSVSTDQDGAGSNKLIIQDRLTESYEHRVE